MNALRPRLRRSNSAGGTSRVNRRYTWYLGPLLGVTPPDSTRHAPSSMRRALTSGVRPSSASPNRSEEHTSELQSLMRISYAVFCLKKKKKKIQQTHIKT